MSSLETLIGQYVFPIAVTGYLLVERSQNAKKDREDRNNNALIMSKALKDFTTALTELKTIIKERIPIVS